VNYFGTDSSERGADMLRERKLGTKLKKERGETKLKSMSFWGQRRGKKERKESPMGGNWT